MSNNINNQYTILGEIRLFPYDFDADGWLPCDGRSLLINGPDGEYLALYSLLKNRFGGIENKFFNLPNIPTVGIGTQVRYFIAIYGTYPDRTSN